MASALPQPPANATIRRLDAADADLWRAIRLQSLQDSPDAFGATYEQAVAQPAEWFRDRLIGSDPMFGAFVANNIVGSAGCYVGTEPKSLHKGHIWAMYVAPDHRRSGIGRALLEAVIADLSPRVDQFHLGVVAGNPAGYDFYRRLGFAAYGIEPRAMRSKGRDLDLILMAKLLR